MKLTAGVFGSDPRSTFGALLDRGHIGFIFEKRQSAIQASLDAKQKITIFIWSQKTMVSFETSGDQQFQQLDKLALIMKTNGADSFVTIGCNFDTIDTIRKINLRWL
jgi:hypothetical protein